MQKDETATCTDSALDLGSVAKVLSDVSQSKSEYSPSSQHGCVTGSSSFYDGGDYPPLNTAMKRDPLSTAHSPAEGNKNYGHQVGYGRTNAPVGREGYHGELYYRESESFNEGLDLTTPAFGKQDQTKLGKGVFNSGGHGLEGTPLEQNQSYFGVPLPNFPIGGAPPKNTRDGQAHREKAAFAKERKAENIQKQNYDGKPIRILQRPALVTSTNLEKQTDDGKMVDALTLLPQKRGHRKKTLSLNPEEREALESLVEEVIIGGFEEDIASSDGSVSEEEEPSISKSVEENKKSPKDRQNKVDLGLRFPDRTPMDKEVKSYQQSDAVDGKKNHFQKDTPSKAMNKYGRKDQRKTKENDNFGMKAKSELRTTEYNSPQGKSTSPNSEKEKLDVRVQGLNIYPAQLKVAIKHMDSLPPRFLRRLQSGQNRMDLILPRRLDMSSDERADLAMGENDRGRSKETQLQETKKSIRNLLCDLDQYVDEGVVTPIMKDSMSSLPFSISPHDRSNDGSAFRADNFSAMLKQQHPQDMSSLTYLNQQAFTSRLFPMPMGASGNMSALSLGPRGGGGAGTGGGMDAVYTDDKSSSYLSRPMVYHCEDVEKLLKSGSDISTLANEAMYVNSSERKDFSQPAMEHFPTGLTSSEEYGLYKQSANLPSGTKKSQFSVDAPEFVSVFFKTGQSSDANSVFEPRSSMSQLQIGNGGVNFSQPGLHMPLYASEAETSQAATSRDILPGVTAADGMSRIKFLGIPCSAEGLMPYQQAHYAPSSTLASSSYLDPSPGSQLQSELFPAHVPCPPPPPSHPMVGVMPYQPYQLPQYVSGFGHPDFPLDRSNFLVPAAPNWISELQVPNSVPPMATMGWCPAGQAQSPYVNCSLGQQVPGKNPMMMCNPGQFAPPEPVDSMVAWNCLNPSTDFDAIYQRVTDVLNGGGCSLIILMNGPALDLSSMTRFVKHEFCSKIVCIKIIIIN